MSGAIGVALIMSEDLADEYIKKCMVHPGLKLKYSLTLNKVNFGAIKQISWSPDGTRLAVESENNKIKIWEFWRALDFTPLLNSLFKGECIPWNTEDNGDQKIVLTSPGCRSDIYLASNNRILLNRLTVRHTNLNLSKDELANIERVSKFITHDEHIFESNWAYSQNRRILAINIFDPRTIDIFSKVDIFMTNINTSIGTSNILESTKKKQINISNKLPTSDNSYYNDSYYNHIRTLEGHTNDINSLSFSFDGKFLASRSIDSTIRIWDCDKWHTLAILQELGSDESSSILTFNPKKNLLATIAENGNKVNIWELDADILASYEGNAVVSEKSVHYANAKVVLVGDSGVGKSGLGLVLTGQAFEPTESTHGRRVWTLDKQEVELSGGQKETRETILWDLAGQPGYRLIHQLHLNELAVALVLFDARSETDPFAGVRHWDRALSQAQRVQGESALPMKKFLVAARTDRGGISVSRARIEALRHDMGFNDYFETSAKEGWNIPELANAIRRSIDWESLPKVTSTELFQRIKDFFIKEKETGRVLSEADDLYRLLLIKYEDLVDSERLRAQFETCIGRVESRGLIRRLSFGDLLLLQPELLDAYASALVNEAKNEPDGQGCIAEEDALSGQFSMSEDERVKDRKQEKLLLIATVEEILCREIALREHADDGSYLVFPSQFTRENPDLPDPEGKAVIFTFEGPIINVYATLAVRISHSGLFTLDEMWKNAATYNATVGGKCGIFLREVEEGRGEMALFFDTMASEETRFQFEEYIKAHLLRRALPERINRRRIFVCPECATPLTELQVTRRRERGHDWIECNVCSERISLLDREERLKSIRPSAIPEMDLAADIQRVRETAASTIQGKIETDDFDVFLCHNSKDKEAVKRIGTELKEMGLLPWLDEWELRPGLPWQPELEEKMERIKSAAVFVGVEGIGPWQRQEIDALLREFVGRQCPVIPILLPDVPKKPELPVFLKGMTWIDFRKDDPDPMEQLIWGITGKRVFDPTCKIRS